ncbi:hypothetical protein MPSEU_000659600 [Mayamaea pseudoterrestris]|nr:hypothetical protein MPSEU_000659600 [Mayamaea pseudoterrestris]
MTMLRTLALFSLAIVPGALASPAIVWSDAANSRKAIINAKSTPVNRVLSELSYPSDAAGRSVVFLLGRNKSDGSEALSKLAESGALAGVSKKYESAMVHHTHVSGLDSAATLVREAKKTGKSATQMSLAEFNESVRVKDASEVTNGKSKRARVLAEANVWIVSVDANADASQLDAATVAAIENVSFSNVVLTAQRSVDEVKVEREMFTHRRLQKMQQAASRLLSQNSRRLEDAQGDDANNNNNNNNDLQGVYYVNMTPNILAGILFTFFFAFVIMLAVSCMGMISGQDVYVTKMPSVGREA